MGSSRLDELTARARATIAASLGPSAAPGSGADSIASPASAPEVSHLVVLGIDPGLATTGYGVVAGSTRADGSYAAIEFDTIETAAGTGTPSRLAEIHARAGLLLRRHCPAVVAIERLFFGANATTAMAVGQARGVLILEIGRAHV